MREEDGLALVRENTATCVCVEDGVKWRLNIRKHFPALDGIWAAEPAPGPSCEPPLRGDRLRLSRGWLGGPLVRAACPPRHHGWDFPYPFLLP